VMRSAIDPEVPYVPIYTVAEIRESRDEPARP